MGKGMKSHRGARKRFKVTAKGKVVHLRTGKQHLMKNKTARRKRRLRREGQLEGADAKVVRTILQQ